MNNNDLMDALSGLDPKYIEEAAFELHDKPISFADAKKKQTKKHLFIVLPAVAAAIVFLGVAIVLPTISRLNKGESASMQSDAAAPAPQESAAEAPAAMNEEPAYTEEAPAAMTESAEAEEPVADAEPFYEAEEAAPDQEYGYPEGSAKSANGTASDRITFGGKNYALTFSDDFDYFDPDKWALCPEQVRQDAGGEWRDSCTAVENGELVITCDIAEDGTPISGAIRSTKKHEQTYGLYHMRFKADKADGLWYAFWLLTDRMNDSSVGNGAKDGAELDIMELVPHTGELGMSVHWDGYGSGLKSASKYAEVDDDFYDSYHELWYEWDKDGYRLYLDGTDEAALVFDFDGEEYGDGTCSVPCDMIISAEYGTWGGRINKAQLPAHFRVDYVQVYSTTDR